MSSIGLDTVVSRGAGHVETRMGEQTVMMSIDQGKYFALQESGQRIWELMEDPIRVDALIDRLSGEYEVSRERCRDEVLGFLEDLRQHGLLAEH